ncbi:MAG: hypothetical protein AAFQ82_05850 [Myxococcota bacterium]
MKVESTIRKEIRRLKRLSQEYGTGTEIGCGAYDAYHALSWVLGERQNCSTYLRGRAKDIGARPFRIGSVDPQAEGGPNE